MTLQGVNKELDRLCEIIDNELFHPIAKLDRDTRKEANEIIFRVRRDINSPKFYRELVKRHTGQAKATWRKSKRIFKRQHETKEGCGIGETGT